MNDDPTIPDVPASLPVDVAPAPAEAPAATATPAPADAAQQFSERNVTNPNVTLTKDVDSPLKRDWDEDHLKFVNGDAGHVKDLLDQYPNLDPDSGDTTRIWAEIVRAGQWYLNRHDQFSKSSQREGSNWRQAVPDADGQPLAAGKPRFEANPGSALSGERAMMKARAVFGLGALVQIPLWHTGIWVSIKAPEDGALLELNRRMAREKAELGRLTNGAVFSNSMVYTNSILVNFALQHVYESTVADSSPQALKQRIKVTDLPTLVWGLVCAIYPNGYPYARACLNRDCEEVIKANLEIPRLAWTDNDLLTEWQRRHMQRRTVRVSEEDLERYQREHRVGGPRGVGGVDDDVFYEMSVPTLQQYEDSGYAWVDGISQQMEKAFGVELKGQERAQYIADQARISATRQYAHWISNMRLGDEEIAQERDTLESIVGLMTGRKDLAEAFFKNVRTYIDDSTLSHIALPKHSCPKCETDQTPKNGEAQHPWLIPLDVGKVFFTLLDQHITKALARNTL